MMTNLINRRWAFALICAGVILSACGLKPYNDLGPKNVTVVLSAVDTSVFKKREVFFEVWRGTPGRKFEHLGTSRINPGKQQFGLPQGEPLVIFLAFDEGGGWFDADLQTNGIEIPVNVKPGQAYLLSASFPREGFDYKFKRVR